jgi:hypothetical protein
MAIACPAEGVGVKRLPGLGQEIAGGRASPNRIVEWWNGGDQKGPAELPD